ncbi:hypothetical protein GZL_06919 [Streptomyces sp. 769]|nr:hypothetical protein GZL_06919 [Streptomyces sp. 769]
MAGNSSSSGSSNFENATHQALYDMVAGADHTEISFTGASLTQAGKEIERIATELKAHVERVQWEGEGADAFREWSNDTVKQSHKLAHFASTTGNALSDAGTALWEAKSMPQPKQNNAVQLDSAATPTARGATGAPLMTDPDREAAVTAMNRLASYYRTAQQTIESQEPPNFKPASGFVPDPPGSARHDRRFEILDQPTGRESANGAGGAGTESSTGSSGGEPRVAESRTPVGGVQQDKQVGTSVNSTTPVLPDATTSHGSTVPVHSGSSGNPPGPVMPGPRTTPGTAKPPADHGRAIPDPQSNAARPGTAKKLSRSAAGGGIVDATTQRAGTATGRPGLPDGRAIGEERGVLPSRPVNAGGNPPTPGNRAISEGTASAGQRPAPPHGEAASAPRGLAMSEDRSAMGRSYPGSSTSRGMPQSVPGRRFAYEPGGTVGASPGGPVVGGEQSSGAQGSPMGRSSGGGAVEGPAPETPTATGRGSASGLGGAAGRAQAPRDRAADFTSGGSGLARGNASGGIVPGTPSYLQRRRRGSAQRPDYLYEDGEAWTAQDGSIVPPVIE